MVSSQVWTRERGPEEGCATVTDGQINRGSEWDIVSPVKENWPAASVSENDAKGHFGKIKYSNRRRGKRRDL